MLHHLIVTLLLTISTTTLAAPNAQQLLEQSDHARGGGLAGLVWEIQLQSRDGQKIAEAQHMEVRATKEASLAETLEPARSKGAKLLQVGRSMWMSKVGLSKPIPISPRQRLSGQAANGDIAATNYTTDYDATFLQEETLDGELCYVLALNAKHKNATYDRIRYWVSAKQQYALKAEFYSLSDKLLKTARFEYNNRIDYQGKKIPFVSKMVIRDALIDAETTMHYNSVKARNIAPAEFDIGQL